MTSRYTETLVTLTIDGDERDCGVRGFVEVEPGLGMGGAIGAVLDGDPEILLGNDWWPLDSVNLDAGDAERISDALCDVALEDDADQCVEWRGAAE